MQHYSNFTDMWLTCLSSNIWIISPGLDKLCLDFLLLQPLLARVSCEPARSVPFDTVFTLLPTYYVGSQTCANAVLSFWYWLNVTLIFMSRYRTGCCVHISYSFNYSFLLLLCWPKHVPVCVNWLQKCVVVQLHIVTVYFFSKYLYLWPRPRH